MNYLSNFLGKSIRHRIYGGFFFIMSLLLILGITDYLSEVKILNQFYRQNSTVVKAKNVMLIERDVVDLYRQVNTYSVTGRETDKLRVNKSTESILASVRKLLDTNTDTENKVEIQRMYKLLVNHNDNFKRIIEERELRDTLTNRDLPFLSDQISKALERNISIAAKNSEYEAQLLMNEALRGFTEAEKLSLRFLAEPNAKYVDILSIQISQLREKLVNFFNSSNTTVTTVYDNPVSLIKEYEKTLFRVIQATRAYLYSKHVVMAGQAYEFAYMAKKLKKQYEFRAENLMNITTEYVSQTLRTTAIFIVFAILLGTVLTWYTARGIIKPVASLTDTFSKLVSGVKVESIPERERQDEIGEMARAADVFRKLNEQTKDIARQLKERNGELDSFAYVASHDLKAPLQGIHKLASWIKEDVGDSIPGETQIHLEKMQQRVKKMEELLDGLLEYSRIGRVKAHIESVDTQILVNDVIELLGENSKIRVQVDGKLPVVTTQKAALYQVFVNLITNAEKYHDKDQGVVVIASEISDDLVRFSITDDGPGIPENYHEQMFNMYSRCNEDSNIKGSGMGLAIIKKEIEVRGGAISLDSDYKNGARFLFTWPSNGSAGSTV